MLARELGRTRWSHDTYSLSLLKFYYFLDCHGDTTDSPALSFPCDSQSRRAFLPPRVGGFSLRRSRESLVPFHKLQLGCHECSPKLVCGNSPTGYWRRLSSVG